MVAAIVKLAWAATVLGALVLLARGLWAGVYFEPTPEALAEAGHGRLVVAGASLLLLLAAGYAVLVARWSPWVGLGVVVPVLVCGGLTLTAADTLLPVISVLAAYPPAMAGVVGGLLSHGGTRPAAHALP